MTLPSSIDTLICGSGPVGLACAVTLAFEGYKNFLIVDGRKESAQRYSRALVLHSRTLEILETVGCADAAVAKGIPRYAYRIHSLNSGLLLKADLSWFPSKFNYALAIPQSETENILYDRLKELGMDVVWETKIIGLREEGGMKVALFDNGEEVRAKYVIGADGPHSVVRHFSGIPYRDPFSNQVPSDDEDIHNEEFALADVRVKNLSPDLQYDDLGVYFSQHGPGIWIPLKDGMYRVITQVSTDDAPKEPSVEYMQDIMDKRLPAKGTKIVENVWSSSFHVRYRIADQYFVPSLPGTQPSDGPNGGIAIIGDAGHVHSPAGGMGMNLGIRDAIFLGRALIADMKSQDKSQAGLHKWSTDRRKAGHRVIGVAEGITKWGSLPPGIEAWCRDTFIWIVGLMPFVVRMLLWRMSGLVERDG